MSIVLSKERSRELSAKEFLLGNKAKELYLYTKQIIRPVPDDKVDAKDVRKILKQIASAQNIEQMTDLLNKTTEQIEGKKGRRRFPKSETFDLIADIKTTTASILKGVHAANETNFYTDPKTRLRLIKEVVDDCNLLLKFVEIALELKYIDIKRSATWTKKTTDVKYMSLAWLKKDTARAQDMQEKENVQELKKLTATVRQILREEGRG